jgi:hypothetical protein
MCWAYPNAIDAEQLLGESKLSLRSLGGSAVVFAAVPDAGDFEGVAEVVEADAVVADAEAEFGRLDVL